jgi:hypothetical protein
VAAFLFFKWPGYGQHAAWPVEGTVYMPFCCSWRAQPNWAEWISWPTEEPPLYLKAKGGGSTSLLGPTVHAFVAFLAALNLTTLPLSRTLGLGISLMKVANLCMWALCHDWSLCFAFYLLKILLNFEICLHLKVY